MTPKLRLAVAEHDLNTALIDGTVQVEGFEVEVEHSTNDGAIHALRGVSLKIDEGEIVTLIGSNGAGKSTTLRTISGLLKPHTGEIYWLQAGAFSEEKEADNLKAKIALTGLEASVRPVTIPDKGTLFRVRLGPYQSLEDANRIKTALSQNGVGVAIIRTTDEPKPQ